MDNRLNLSRCDHKSDDNNRSIVIDIQYVAMLFGIYIQYVAVSPRVARSFSFIISSYFADQSIYYIQRTNQHTYVEKGQLLIFFLDTKLLNVRAHGYTPCVPFGE